MPISKKRLQEIQAIPDQDIDTSDIPVWVERFWEKAQMVLLRTKKVRFSVIGFGCVGLV